ncbi:hypothetical protein OA092_01205 [bacterium]|nr:hypothetical protein [bacterium]
MGLPIQVLKAIFQESSLNKEIKKIGLFGRQTVHASPSQLEELFNIDISSLDKDKETRHKSSVSEVTFSDRAVLNSIFPKAQIDIFDRSDYEGANIILDLNKTIEEKYHGSYDLIYTGGCLDNIFNPVSVIQNSSRLLSKNGVVIHYESGANLIGAFLYFSSEWFYSYYAVNKFLDCKAYMLQHIEPSELRFEYSTNIYSYSPWFKRDPNFDYLESAKMNNGIYYNLIIAEKSEESLIDEYPCQMQYIDNNSIDWRTRSKIFEKSLRPFLSGSVHIDKWENVLPYNSNHYRYRGSNF